MKTFADTLGHNITVADAYAIIDNLTFPGPAPKLLRRGVLLMHWNADGSRRATFRTIANRAGLHISAVQNQHAHILRRLREHLEGQPPTPTEVSGVGR